MKKKSSKKLYISDDNTLAFLQEGGIFSDEMSRKKALKDSLSRKTMLDMNKEYKASGHTTSENGDMIYNYTKPSGELLSVTIPSMKMNTPKPVIKPVYNKMQPIGLKASPSGNTAPMPIMPSLLPQPMDTTTPVKFNKFTTGQYGIPNAPYAEYQDSGKRYNISKEEAKQMGFERKFRGMIKYNEGGLTPIPEEETQLSLSPGLQNKVDVANNIQPQQPAQQSPIEIQPGGWGSMIGGIAGGALGSLLGPAGTKIGATIGGKLGGAAEDRMVDNKNLNNQMQMKMGGPIYEMGGSNEFPNAEVEGGETMMAPNGVTDNFNGPSHNQGGIPVNLAPGTIIFSDKLKDPITKKSFAELAKKYPTDKFKEKADDKKSTHLERSTAKLMFDKNTKKQEEIYNTQETLKQEKLYKSLNRAYMKYGGQIFGWGGLFGKKKPTQEQIDLENFRKTNPEEFNPDGTSRTQGDEFNPYDNSNIKKGQQAPVNRTDGLVNVLNDKPKHPWQEPSVDISDYDSRYDYMGQPKENWPKGYTMAQPQVDDTDFKPENVDGYKAPAPVGTTGTSGGDSENGTNQLATYAPTIYDIGRGLFGRPNQLNPEDFMSKRLSYRDNDNQASMREARIKAAIDKSNAKNAGTTTGGYLGYAGQASSSAQGTLSKMDQEKQNINNTGRTNVDNINLNLGLSDKQMALNIKNMNLQDRAKKSEFLGRGLEGMSGLAQMNKLMKNQAGRDVIRAKQLNSMFRDFKMQPDGTWKNKATGVAMTADEYNKLING